MPVFLHVLRFVSPVLNQTTLACVAALWILDSRLKAGKIHVSRLLDGQHGPGHS